MVNKHCCFKIYVTFKFCVDVSFFVNKTKCFCLEQKVAFLSSSRKDLIFHISCHTIHFSELENQMLFLSWTMHFKIMYPFWNEILKDVCEKRCFTVLGFLALEYIDICSPKRKYYNKDWTAWCLSGFKAPFSHLSPKIQGYIILLPKPLRFLLF